MPPEALRKLWSTLDLPLFDDQKAALLRDIGREGAEMDKRYQPKGQ
jgi:hypothetical protein